MRHERAIPAAAQIEIRSTGKTHTFNGYAAVFGVDSSPLPYIETVDPGAFARTLTNPPGGRQTFVVDHDDGLLMASTRTERLRLSEDATGLFTEAELPDTSYVRDLRELGDAGELGGMSFEFSSTKDGAPFSGDGKRRRLKEVRLYHVTVLTGKTPAYAETTAAIRALAHATGAEFDDVGVVFDAVREGRKLNADEWSLLEKLVAPIAPEGRWSSAAYDASSASYALQTVLSLLGDEAAETDQYNQLKAAATALQAFIATETDEIGSEADQAASRARPNLEAARALLRA